MTSVAIQSSGSIRLQRSSLSALLYAIVATGLCLPAIWSDFQPLLPPIEETLLVVLAAFAGGLLLARVREMERNGELEPIPEVSAATQ